MFVDMISHTNTHTLSEVCSIRSDARLCRSPVRDTTTSQSTPPLHTRVQRTFSRTVSGTAARRLVTALFGRIVCRIEQEETRPPPSGTGVCVCVQRNLIYAPESARSHNHITCTFALASQAFSIFGISRANTRMAHVSVRARERACAVKYYLAYERNALGYLHTIAIWFRDKNG